MRRGRVKVYVLFVVESANYNETDAEIVGIYETKAKMLEACKKYGITDSCFKEGYMDRYGYAYYGEGENFEEIILG